MKIINWVLETVRKQLFNDLKAVMIAVWLLASIHEDNLGDGKGAEKKEAVMNDLEAEFDKPGGIDLPSYFKGVFHRLFPMMIDFVIDWWNRAKAGQNPGN